MKTDPAYIPNPGFQHTRALAALGIIQLCIDVWDTSDDPKSANAKKLANIQRYLDDCAEQTRKRPLSRGATRAINAYAEIMERNAITEEMTEAERDEQWLVMFWIGLHFIYEVKTTCPLYWEGEKRKSWQLLLRTTENFALALDKLWPEAQNRFAPVYLEISEAMEAA